MNYSLAQFLEVFENLQLFPVDFGHDILLNAILASFDLSVDLTIDYMSVRESWFIPSWLETY
jgi:hypothetical protein